MALTRRVMLPIFCRCPGAPSHEQLHERVKVDNSAGDGLHSKLTDPRWAPRPRLVVAELQQLPDEGPRAASESSATSVLPERP